MAAPSASSPPPDDGPRWSRGFRRTWGAVSAWGDRVESQHFSDVDISGSLAQVVDSIGDAAESSLRTVTDGLDAIEQTAIDGDLIGVVNRAIMGTNVPRERWQYLSPDAWPIDTRSTPDINGARTVNRLESGEFFWAVEERPGADGVLYLRLGEGRGWLFDKKPGVGRLCNRAPLPAAPVESPASGAVSSASSAVGRGEEPPPRSAEELLRDAIARLEASVVTEEEQHRGRVEALRTMQTSLPRLHEELRAATAWKPDDGSQELRSEELRAQALEKAYMELQERHHLLLSRRAKQEAELERFAIAAREEEAAELARVDALAAGGNAAREWARDGPMTDALKSAKLELAEALGLIDETRLESRKELKRMQEQMEVLQFENDQIRRCGEAYVAPQGSIMKSMRRLFTVAKGQDDPFPYAEDAAK